MAFFAYFSDGKFAHFATAGQEDVPDKFRNPLQGWDVVHDFFHALGASYGFDIVEKNVPACETEAQWESYLKSFASMASKGFFSCDFIGGLIGW
ncbi:hypothetical protein [Pseudomonas xanthosomatis]|uniref:hypothetical protein n=1 Tax=Pseudomonas xanthosomatis TaxID=2842356 RepID=UPI0035116ACF